MRCFPRKQRNAIRPDVTPGPCFCNSLVDHDIFTGMTKPKLIYFDAPVSRGEECRLALHLAGIDFEDARIKNDDWPALKAQTPYGSLPVFEMAGQPPLAQTNAILVLVGRRHDLHPTDDFEAARHEAMMQHEIGRASCRERV